MQAPGVAPRRLHVLLDALDLGELGLGLLGLELLGVEAVVEALQLLDLVFVLLVAARGDVVGRGALAHVGLEVAADGGHHAVLEGQHARAHAFEQAAVVGDQHVGLGVVDQVLLEPLDRVDVEVVGRFVEQQQVGVGQQGARQRDARELAARGGEQRTVEQVGGQAEALEHALEVGAVVVAAGQLEAALELLVVLHGGREPGAVLVEAGESLFGRAHRRLKADELGEGLHEVLAHGPVAGELGGLLVQPDAPAAGARHAPGVGVLAARHEAQERGLAAAVASDEDGVVVLVERERDAAEELLAAERFGDVVEGDDGHGPPVYGTRPARASCAAPRVRRGRPRRAPRAVRGAARSRPAVARAAA